jgi:methyl-accepting chemotaxis protein
VEGTKKAATQIDQMVTSIGESTTEVVGGMTTGTKQVAESIEIVNAALGILGQIGEGAKEITSKAEEIATATTQQSKGAEQVAKSTEEIAATSEQAAAGAEQMSTSIQQQTGAMQQMSSSAQNLSSVAEELRGALRRFVLTRDKKSLEIDSQVDESQEKVKKA